MPHQEVYTEQLQVLQHSPSSKNKPRQSRGYSTSTMLKFFFNSAAVVIWNIITLSGGQSSDFNQVAVKALSQQAGWAG